MTKTAVGQTLDIFVPGRPAPQGSKRHIGHGVLLESSKEVGPWRERIALVAHDAMAAHRQMGGDSFTAAVDINLIFVMPRPKSTSKTAPLTHTKRPDLDKLVRAVFDALKDVVWNDDSQVNVLMAKKRLAGIDESPGVHISVIGERAGHRKDFGA